MFDLLLTEPMVPFTLALALLFGLFALELAFSLLGGTLLGLGADADLDVADLDVPDIDGLDLDIDTDLGDYELPEFEGDADVPSGSPSGPLAWLGLGRIPVMIWVAAFLMAFGVSGLVLQQLAVTLFSAPMPAAVAAAPALAVGLWFARTFGSVLSNFVPKTETTAMSNRNLGRRMGVVTQGTARRGVQAEVRVKDRHGNTHYLRAEPLSDEDVIPQGTEVLVLRHRRGKGYRVVSLGEVA